MPWRALIAACFLLVSCLVYSLTVKVVAELVWQQSGLDLNACRAWQVSHWVLPGNKESCKTTTVSTFVESKFPVWYYINYEARSPHKLLGEYWEQLNHPPQLKYPTYVQTKITKMETKGGYITSPWLYIAPLFCNPPLRMQSCCLQQWFLNILLQ
jgi:hypothetical protein